jgi:hypothetical protein
VGFSSLAGFNGSSGGLGLASATFKSREPGRLVVRFFLVGAGEGRGWNAFEIDWPTFLKKSPTGSAFAHRPLKNKRATRSKKIQRIRQLIELSAFNVKPGLSARIAPGEKQIFSAPGVLVTFDYPFVFAND